MNSAIRKIKWPLAAVGATAIALLLMIALELWPSASEAPVETSNSTTSAKPVEIANPQSVSKQSLVTTALSRPLFSPDRKPDKVEQPTVASAEPASDLPRLAGILYSSETRHAVFQASADDKPIVADEGASVSGWKIEQISANSVSLSGPNGKQTLEPVFDPNAKAADPALPAAPPSPPQPAQVPGPQRNPQIPGPAFDPRRFPPNGPAGLPFRPNVPRPFPSNMPRVTPPAPSNH